LGGTGTPSLGGQAPADTQAPTGPPRARCRLVSSRCTGRRRRHGLALAPEGLSLRRHADRPRPRWSLTARLGGSSGAPSLGILPSNDVLRPLSGVASSALSAHARPERARLRARPPTP